MTYVYRKTTQNHYGRSLLDSVVKVLNRDATHVWKKNRKTENIYFCHQWPFPSLPFPTNLLKTGVGPSVGQSCHSLSLLFGGGGKENRKICISVINDPSLPPKPSQTVNPPKL